MKLCWESIIWRHIDEKQNFIFGDFDKKTDLFMHEGEEENTKCNSDGQNFVYKLSLEVKYSCGTPESHPQTSRFRRSEYEVYCIK